jgi:hypothetical protein
MLDFEIEQCEKRLSELRPEGKIALVKSYENMPAAYKEDRDGMIGKMAKRDELVRDLQECMKIELLIDGEDEATSFASYLIRSSKSFILDPMPDGKYSVVVKNENLGGMLEHLDEEEFAEYEVMGKRS